MSRPQLLAAAVALSVLSPLTVGAEPLPTIEPEPVVLDAGRERVRVVRVADGLVWPWDLAFLPGDEALLVTEGPGRLRIVRGGALHPEPVWRVPSPIGNDVLHGVVLHPRFAANRYVYVSYAKRGWRGVTLAVARGRLDGDRLVGVRDIFVADAWAEGPHNTAGRMLFGPDGTLYVSIGDRDRLWVTDDPTYRLRAQSLANHVGKIVRLTDDGRVPADNPLVGRRGVRPEIFAYGFRNGYGLAFHPRTGALWMADIGPLGGDEINIVEPGGNYGWPLVSTGSHYSGTPVTNPAAALSDAQAPVLDWVPAISPSSIAFYSGDAFPEWRGSLLVSALSGQQVQRIAFDAAGEVRRREPLLAELGVRFRLVAQGPDGCLYVATETGYGSGKPDGAILRIEPIR